MKTNYPKISIILISLFLSNFAFSQVNVDSLLKVVQSDYNQIGTKDYLMTDFTVYESLGKRDRYDIYVVQFSLISKTSKVTKINFSY